MRQVSILRLHEEYKKRQKQQIQKKIREKSVEANKKSFWYNFLSSQIFFNSNGVLFFLKYDFSKSTSMNKKIKIQNF